MKRADYRHRFDKVVKKQAEFSDQQTAPDPSAEQGGTISDVMPHVGSISKADLRRMQTAIDEDCERIHTDEWYFSS